MAQRLRDAERRRRAVQLARDGLSFAEIAATLDDDGVPLYSSRQAAHRAVASEVRKVAGVPAAELRALELARLDDLHRSVWPEATTPGEAVRCPEDGCPGVLWRTVNHTAVRSTLSIMERRASLVGLDARHRLDSRAVELLEDQVQATHRVLTDALQRAGLAPEVRRVVLHHVGQGFRELDEHAGG